MSNNTKSNRIFFMKEEYLVFFSDHTSYPFELIFKTNLHFHAIVVLAHSSIYGKIAGL